jgi:hypothetical protein
MRNKSFLFICNLVVFFAIALSWAQIYAQENQHIYIQNRTFNAIYEVRLRLEVWDQSGTKFSKSVQLGVIYLAFATTFDNVPLYNGQVKLSNSELKFNPALALENFMTSKPAYSFKYAEHYDEIRNRIFVNFTDIFKDPALWTALFESWSSEAPRETALDQETQDLILNFMVKQVPKSLLVVTYTADTVSEKAWTENSFWEWHEFDPKYSSEPRCDKHSSTGSCSELLPSDKLIQQKICYGISVDKME